MTDSVDPSRQLITGYNDISDIMINLCSWYPNMALSFLIKVFDILSLKNWIGFHLVLAEQCGIFLKILSRNRDFPKLDKVANIDNKGLHRKKNKINLANKLPPVGA